MRSEPPGSGLAWIRTLTGAAAAIGALALIAREAMPPEAERVTIGHVPQAVAVAPDDVERLGADRAGRAQDQDSAWSTHRSSLFRRVPESPAQPVTLITERS